MISKEEIKKIKEIISAQISEEISPTFDGFKNVSDYVALGTVLAETKMLTAYHNLYHTIEQVQNCQLASDSIVVKVFLMGYNCRKALEEENELAKLVSEIKA